MVNVLVRYLKFLAQMTEIKFHLKILFLFVLHGLAISIVGIYQIQTLYISQKNSFQERIFIESTIVQRRFETVLDNLKKTVDILQSAQEITTGMISHDVDLLHGWATLFIPKYADKIQFVNETGLVMARGDSEFRFGDSVNNAIYFQKALHQNVFIGIDTLDGKQMLIVSKRMTNSGNTSQGIIAIGVHLNSDFFNNLVLGTHMGIDYNSTPHALDTTSSIQYQTISLHESLDKGGIENIGLYIVLKSHDELDAIVTTRRDLLIGFLILFIPFGILIYSIIFRYLKHYNTFMHLLFDFYENKIHIDAFTQTVKRMVEGNTSSEIKKISNLFLKIVQKMNNTKEHFVNLSETDVLTTIANRRKLDDVLEIKVKEAERGVSLSIILIDIDKFKKINDTYGHDIGDTILQEFASILQNSIRQTDSVGRWGGEEFLLILPTTQNEGALALASTIREKIESFHFTLDISVTASLGVATYHAEDTERNLIKRADDALYRAKHLGRNRIENEKI